MKNILILTYWSFPEGLIQAYTLPYLRIIKKNLPAGSMLFLVTLEKDKNILLPKSKDIIEEKLLKEGIIWLPFIYRPFGLSAFFLWTKIGLSLSILLITKKIFAIHCWCTPAGAIGYLLSSVFNCRLVIDSYEPHAESMVENGSWKENSLAFRLLFWLEKKQTFRADYLIGTTLKMEEYAFAKYASHINNFIVKPACVNLTFFSENKVKDKLLMDQLDLRDKVVCVYAGKFGGIYLEDEAFDFFKVASLYWGDNFRILLLTPHSRDEIDTFCSRAGLRSALVISKFVDHQDVPKYLGLGDFAITPVKPVPSKRYCTPIKDGEYWAMGLPIVIPSNISDDAEIIENNGIGAILKSFTVEEYQQAVERIEQILKQPKYDTFARIREVAIQYRGFEIAEKVYREVYSRLI